MLRHPLFPGPRLISVPTVPVAMTWFSLEISPPVHAKSRSARRTRAQSDIASSARRAGRQAPASLDFGALHEGSTRSLYHSTGKLNTPRRLIRQGCVPGQTDRWAPGGHGACTVRMPVCGERRLCSSGAKSTPRLARVSPPHRSASPWQALAAEPFFIFTSLRHAAAVDCCCGGG